MVFVDAAIAWRDKKKAQWAREAAMEYEEGVAAGWAEVVAEAAGATNAAPIARAIQQARERGREDAHQTWSDWYARFTDAKARGVPFHEAPPEATPTP